MYAPRDLPHSSKARLPRAPRAPRTLEPTGVRAWLDAKGYRLIYQGSTVTAEPLEGNPSGLRHTVHQHPGEPLAEVLRIFKDHLKEV